MIRRAVILAGGFGIRLMEETEARPKPMVEIGGKPILWHIMKLYSACGVNEFVIPLGYKGHMIKRYFAEYYLHGSDVTINLESNDVKYLKPAEEPWTVTLIDTGLETMTGGRLLRLRHYLGDEPFAMTYGDGVMALDLAAVLAYHKSHGRIATLTAVKSPSRYGILGFNKDVVSRFNEKPENIESWINGGFFILSPRVLDYIDGDNTVFERDPLERLASDGQLMAYKHEKFWYGMDTLRDKKYLESLWATGEAPWKIW
jgi:glucose-1-phosphate cytidylyltransferase